MGRTLPSSCLICPCSVLLVLLPSCQVSDPLSLHGPDNRSGFLLWTLGVLSHRLNLPLDFSAPPTHTTPSPRTLCRFFQTFPPPTSDGHSYFKPGNQTCPLLWQHRCCSGYITITSSRKQCWGKKMPVLMWRSHWKGRGHPFSMALPDIISTNHSGTFLLMPKGNLRESNTTFRLSNVILNPYGILDHEIWLGRGHVLLGINYLLMCRKLHQGLEA